jgi:hypothetical protein
MLNKFMEIISEVYNFFLCSPKMVVAFWLLVISLLISYRIEWELCVSFHLSV